MPGEGDLPVQEFVQAVAATGYDGPISLEIFNDQFRGGNPGTIAKDGFRSLISMMDDVRRSEPDVLTDLPAMPERVAVNGVEFIEFTTRGADAEALGELLSSMGFVHAGDHVSKKVALWRQGDIRIVLNQETTGFASSAYAMHGTSICDVGLRVQDAVATSERAVALGASPFKQAVGPGEMEIPAIRSVGGSVLHFIDEASGLSDVWSVEFREAGVRPDGDAGLRRVDHVAETMSYDEMLSWSLFYTTIFDMHRTPMVDVIDPDGLVRSQAIKARNGSARITLNGAETHRTLAGSFLADSFGGAVQHVAFATDDIFDAARRMARLGFQPLAMTENYYQDLRARFAIEPARLDELKALNILYDEEDGHAFYQFYSKPFHGGLFFEIVQRVDGYDGYGAPNAPFRIAAQKRLMRPKGVPKK